MSITRGPAAPPAPPPTDWTAFDEACLLVYTDMIRNFRTLLHTRRRDSPEVSATMAFIAHYTKLYPKVDPEIFRRYGGVPPEANHVQSTEPSV